MRRYIFFAAFLLVPLLSVSAQEKTPPTGGTTAQAELSDADISTLTELVNKLGESFVAGSAEDCIRLFSPAAPEREKVSRSLQYEFQQARYTTFQVLSIVPDLPDDSLKPGVHRADVRFRFTYLNRHVQAEAQERIENSTTQTFLFRKTDDGKFTILSSPFFDTLGRRQGVGLIVDAVLGVTVVCAVLTFWVWMGFEAWRARPRTRFWRWFVLVPIIGAVLYFVLSYIPRQFRRVTGTGISI